MLLTQHNETTSEQNGLSERSIEHYIVLYSNIYIALLTT